MLKAAIMSAYYANLAYYAANGDDESNLSYERKYALISHCLALLNYAVYSKAVDAIDRGMHDKKNRSTFMDNIEQTKFAWQLIGSGLAQSEEDELCQKGDY